MLSTKSMKTKNSAFAAFKTKSEVERAFTSLNSEGFSASEVAIVMPDHDGDKDFAASDHRTRIIQGVSVGAGVGLMIGLIVGFFAGLQAFGGLFVANIPINPFTGALIGGLFGAIGGAASGALIGIGTPASPVERYATYLEDGGILVSVHAEDHQRALRAMDILEQNGGTDITETNENESWNGVLTRTRNFRPV